jgi:hypothetical protein
VLVGGTIKSSATRYERSEREGISNIQQGISNDQGKIARKANRVLKGEPFAPFRTLGNWEFLVGYWILKRGY